MMHSSPVLIQIEVVSITAAAGAKFTGEQSDDRQPGPLGKPERLEELFLGVLKGGSDRIYGGESQADTSVSVEWGRKYCKLRSGSNEFCRECPPLGPCDLGLARREDRTGPFQPLIKVLQSQFALQSVSLFAVANLLFQRGQEIERNVCRLEVPGVGMGHIMRK
jgi:hypothetical protein